MKKFLLSIIILAFIGCNTNDVKAINWFFLSTEKIDFQSNVAKDLYRTMPRWYEHGLTGKVQKIKVEDINTSILQEAEKLGRSSTQLGKAYTDDYINNTIPQERAKVIKASQWEATKSNLATGACVAIALTPVACMVYNNDYRNTPWQDIAAVFIAGGAACYQYNKTKAIHHWTNKVSKSI